MAKPFVKWIGSESILLDNLLDTLPLDDFKGTYHEPFLGGGVVLLGVLSKWPNLKCEASDINEVLVYCYKNIQKRLHQVLSAAHCDRPT